MGAGRFRWLRWELGLVAVSIIVALTFASIMVGIAASRPLSPLEAVLFQIIALGVGLGGGLFGSYKFGQSVAANRQYARSALRSVLVLFRSLQRLHEAIERLKPGSSSNEQFEQLQLHIENQMDIAYSVINDWRDLIPEEFEDVGENLERPRN